MGAWREFCRIITCIDFRLISKQPFYYRNFRKQLNREENTSRCLHPHEVTAVSVSPARLQMCPSPCARQAAAWRCGDARADRVPARSGREAGAAGNRETRNGQNTSE